MNQIEFANQASKVVPELFQYALRYTNDREDAEDLLQDTMVRAMKYHNQFEAGSNLKGWLYTILKHTFINEYRRRSKIQALIIKTDILTAVNLSTGATYNTAEGGFIMKDIAKALKAIPELYSIPFISYFEGYKYQEIAESLNLPLGTVKTRIHEARNLLKKYLLTYSKIE
jgi:RNA polymerase sigma factor (sigma-70 family)